MTVGVPRLPKKIPDYIPFQGILDTETPAWNVPVGYCREAQNFERAVNGGIRTITGYERFDGQTSPSAAVYAIFTVTITGSFSAGDTITGVTSGATAYVVSVVTGDTDYLVITKITNTFDSGGETLNVGGLPQGTTSGSPVVGGASTAALNATYTNAAADIYRADISAVPGSGNVLGIMVLNDVRYAFRNNAGGTACDVYKDTTSGWAQVTLTKELSFTSGGTYTIAEGDTITGHTSTETAVVQRVVLTSGTWAGGDAAGKLIITTQSGAFQAETLDVGANVDVATIAGDSTAITLDPDGRFEYVVHNFGGESGEDRIYAVDGVNRGFEFDGTILVPIDTGMTTDTPLHVCVFMQHLFFSYAGSAQHSGIATPYIWSPVFGASELALGDDITGFQEQPGTTTSGALAIFSRNRTHILYGTSTSDWNLVKYRGEVGAFAYSMQDYGRTGFLDDRGVTDLYTSQSFGNFNHNTLTQIIQTWLNDRLGTLNDSCIVRTKNQYRLFFSDDYALYLTFHKNKLTGMMPVLLDHTVTCMTSVELSDGTEAIYFGSDNGMVYQMEKGTSFDGADINFYAVLHFHNSKSPTVNKKYCEGTFEIAGDGYSEFNFTYELGYASVLIPQPNVQQTTLSFSSVLWDMFTWDAFYWDGQTLTPTKYKLEGSAENISLIIRGSGDYFAPITVSGAVIHYIPRRLQR